jgi:hypothetical protein
MPFVDYFQEREQEAEKLDRERGEKRGLLEGIQAMLAVQLPAREKELMARAEQVDDLDLLRRVLKAAAAADAEGLSRLLP